MDQFIRIIRYDPFYKVLLEITYLKINFTKKSV